MKKITGKVQTSNYGNNILVETETSTNKHYSYLNFMVSVEKVLTDDEIISLWEQRDCDDRLELAKNWIKKQGGVCHIKYC